MSIDQREHLARMLKNSGVTVEELKHSSVAQPFRQKINQPKSIGGRFNPAPFEISQTAYGGDYTFLDETQIELDGLFSKSDLVKLIAKMKD